MNMKRPWRRNPLRSFLMNFLTVSSIRNLVKSILLKKSLPHTPSLNLVTNPVNESRLRQSIRRWKESVWRLAEFVKKTLTGFVKWQIKRIKVPYIRHFLCIYRLLCYQIDTNNIESVFLMRNWMCILYLSFSLWCNYFCDSCTSSLLTIGLLLVLLCSDFSDVRLFFKRYYVIIYAGIQSPIHFCLV